MLASQGIYFEAARISGLAANSPAAWSASETGKSYVHDGGETVNIETDAGPVSVKWSLVAGYQPPPSPPRPTRSIGAPSTASNDSGWARLVRGESPPWRAESAEREPFQVRPLPSPPDPRARGKQDRSEFFFFSIFAIPAV